MLQAIKEFFDARISPSSGDRERDPEQAYRLATAALLMEMSRADHHVSQAERDAVAAAVRRAFDMPADETAELMELAEREAETATDLYGFTSLIRDQFSAEEKEHVIELMWRIAYADGELDKYEEHLVRQVAELLYVPHSRFMLAKHRALGEAE